MVTIKELQERIEAFLRDLKKGIATNVRTRSQQLREVESIMQTSASKIARKSNELDIELRFTLNEAQRAFGNGEWEVLLGALLRFLFKIGDGEIS